METPTAREEGNAQVALTEMRGERAKERAKERERESERKRERERGRENRVRETLDANLNNVLLSSNCSDFQAVCR